MMKLYRYILIIMMLSFATSCVNFISDEELNEKFRIAVENKNWNHAKGYIDEIIERNPDDANAYLSRAQILTNVDITSLVLIIKDLSKYLEYNEDDEVARFLRFQAYFMNLEYDKALQDINDIIELKGKNAFLLSWKGNCAFAAKKFNLAVASYEERLKLRGSYDDLRNNYYYLIFSKYLAGNKEGAFWDCAFLEKRGFTEDSKLMEALQNDEIKHEQLSKFQIPPLTRADIAKTLNNSCPDLDLKIEGLMYRSELMEQFAHLETTKDLKKIIANKKEVYSLSLSYAGLNELPQELLKCINLEYLDLSGNNFLDLEKLVQDLSQLPNLRVLKLNRCKIKVLPKNIQLLSNLEVLSLAANRIKVLSEDIGSLNKLKLLSLTNNRRLTDLPKSIGALQCLELLNVSGTSLKRLRNELANCQKLISITANASKIETLPENIGDLINLKYINLVANKVKFLPISIGGLKELKTLSLGSNEIEFLPKEISQLENLERISLEFNRFKEFPKQILELEKIYSIWIHNNNIKNIPLEVAKMKAIQRVLIDHEIITDKNISNLKEVNPELILVRHDTRRYVKGKKRKK